MKRHTLLVSCLLVTTMRITESYYNLIFENLTLTLLEFPEILIHYSTKKSGFPTVLIRPERGMAYYWFLISSSPSLLGFSMATIFDF